MSASSGPMPATAMSLFRVDERVRDSTLDGVAYYEIVADAVGDLGEGVGGARCDEHNVGPAAKLDVQNGISDAIVRIPFIDIRPHIHSQTANVPRLEEGERWLGRCHLHGHVLVLYAHGEWDQKNIIFRKTFVGV